MSDRPPEADWTLIHYLVYAIQDLLAGMDQGTIDLKKGQDEIKEGLITLAQLLHDQIDEIPGKTAEEIEALLNDSESLMNGLLSDIKENTSVTNAKLSSLDDYLRNEIGYNIANMTADIDSMRDNLVYIGETLTTLPEDIASELSDDIKGLQNGITDSLDSNTKLIIHEINAGNSDLAEELSGLKKELSSIIQSQTAAIVHSMDGMTVLLTDTIKTQFQEQIKVLDTWREDSTELLERLTELETDLSDIQIAFYSQFWDRLRSTIDNLFEFNPAEVATQMVQIIGAINTLTNTMSTMNGGGK